MNKINFYLQSRLDSVKKRAAEIAKRDPDGAYQWALNHQVKYKRKGWIKYDTANHYSPAGDLCTENLAAFDAVPIQDISRRAFDYSGYYCDNYQMGLIKPYIVKIKTSRGLFIAPAIEYSDCDIATIYISRGQLVEKGADDEAAAYDAAQIADSIAEREAEQGREDDAKFQAEQITENLKDENREALKEARGLIQAIRDQRAIGEIVKPICDALISEIKGIRQTIRRNNQRMAALKENYWLAVE